MSTERQRRESLDASRYSIAVIASRFNEEITEALLSGATGVLRQLGVRDENLEVVSVPGAFELPLAAKRLAQTGRFDAVIAIGAVIRGETGHYELVANEAAAGIQRAALDTGVPVIFGVLATEDEDQARARSGGALGNRGEDAAYVAIEMAELFARFSDQRAGSISRAGRTG